VDQKLKPLGEVELFDYEVDAEALKRATDDRGFVEAGLDLLKEITQIIIVLASGTRMTPDDRGQHWTRDEAVLGGLMVRLMKLLVGFIEGATKHGGEIANYFTRGLLETAINLRYLIQRDSPEAFQAFVAHSFRNDKRLLELMEKNIAERGGTELPIERRMRDSIERMLERSRLTLADIPSRKTDAWPSFEERLDALDMKDGYTGVFGGPSSYIHGTWHELLSYNLRVVGDGFELDPSRAALRPEPLFALAVALATAGRDYIDYLLSGYPEAAVLKDRLLRAEAKARCVDDLHEAFLNRAAPSGAGLGAESQGIS
jgi:hypothetical protein